MSARAKSNLRSRNRKCSARWPLIPTISRLIDTFAHDPDPVIAAICVSARAAARDRVWGHRACPVGDTGPVVIDLDATLDRGAFGEREVRPRPSSVGSDFIRCWPSSITAPAVPGSRWRGCCARGRANANDAADQIAVLDAALAELPEQVRSRALVRGDSG